MNQAECTCLNYAYSGLVHKNVLTEYAFYSLRNSRLPNKKVYLSDDNKREILMYLLWWFLRMWVGLCGRPLREVSAQARTWRPLSPSARSNNWPNTSTSRRIPDQPGIFKECECQFCHHYTAPKCWRWDFTTAGVYSSHWYCFNEHWEISSQVGSNSGE